jgi:hypothetical protein
MSDAPPQPPPRLLPCITSTRTRELSGVRYHLHGLAHSIPPSSSRRLLLTRSAKTLAWSSPTNPKPLQQKQSRAPPLIATRRLQNVERAVVPSTDKNIGFSPVHPPQHHTHISTIPKHCCFPNAIYQGSLQGIDTDYPHSFQQQLIHP